MKQNTSLSFRLAVELLFNFFTTFVQILFVLPIHELVLHQINWQLFKRLVGSESMQCMCACVCVFVTPYVKGCQEDSESSINEAGSMAVQLADNSLKTRTRTHTHKHTHTHTHAHAHTHTNTHTHTHRRAEVD